MRTFSPNVRFKFFGYCNLIMCMLHICDTFTLSSSSSVLHDLIYVHGYCILPLCVFVVGKKEIRKATFSVYCELCDTLQTVFAIHTPNKMILPFIRIT